MAELKIVDVRTAPSAQPGRVGQVDQFVFYTIDARPAPYMLRLPAESGEAAILEAVKRDAQERLKLIGKTLSV